MTKKNEDKKEKYAASRPFQIILILISGLIIAWMLSKPIVGFKSTDEYPEIVPLTPKKIIKFGGAPSIVDIGMYIRDFSEFDMVKGIFVADLTLWFKFDPLVLSLDRIGKFTFDGAKILKKSKPYTKIESDKLVANYDMRIEFKGQLNYKNFPFDDHRVNFPLTNYFLTPSEANFESTESDFILNPKLKIAGWRYIDKGLKTGYVEYKLGIKGSKIHPRIVFYLDFARVGTRHIITILIPLIIVFFISLFTLTFDPYVFAISNIISISIASISAVIAHRFIMESMSPKAGYFMISDKLFLLYLVVCSVIFVVNIFSRKIPGFYKNILSLILHVATLAYIAYIFKPLI